ncbi:hypothetical protein ACF1G0_14950 [Streptomyces sp. NPDC013953]|uniref:hypothetical protein n=1 Tax=Streptomyces sp. NPDC013953 TaxID=3364868 RepID=UPI0036FF5EFD
MGDNGGPGGTGMRGETPDTTWVRSPRRARVRRFLGAVPALMIVGGIGDDLATAPAFTAVPLFALAPLIAVPFFTARTTLAGLAAVLAVVGLRPPTPRAAGGEQAAGARRRTPSVIGACRCAKHLTRSQKV